MKDTGVRFSDIAGMDNIVFEMREVVKMLLGDAAYKRVGAKPPKVGGSRRRGCATDAVLAGPSDAVLAGQECWHPAFAAATSPADHQQLPAL